MMSDVRHVGFVLANDFELLDVFGPADIFGVLEKFYSVELIAKRKGPIKSAQGHEVLATRTLNESNDLDILLVLGV